MTDLSPAALRARAEEYREIAKLRGGDSFLITNAFVLDALADRESAVVGDERERIARLLWETAGDDSVFRDELTSDWQSFWGNSSIARSTLCSVTDRIIADREAAISRAREETRERCAQAAEKVGTPVGAGDGDTYIPGSSADAAHAIRALPLSPSQPSSAKGGRWPSDDRLASAVRDISLTLDGNPARLLQRAADRLEGRAPTPSADVDAAVAGEREAIIEIARSELRNTDILLSHPPQSSAAWNIIQAIRARSTGPSGGE